MKGTEYSMKKKISIMLTIVMVLVSLCSTMSYVSADSGTPTPLYNFNFESAESLKLLVNTHLIVTFDTNEGAVRFLNFSSTTQQDQGVTPTSSPDPKGTDTNTKARKEVAEKLKKATFAVITYKNISDNTMGGIRTSKETVFYNMPAKMNSYADVIVPAHDGLAFRDGGDQYQAPFCFYPFTSTNNGEIKKGGDQILYIKNIAAFEKYDDAVSYAKANVASGKTTEYTYADQSKLELGYDIGYSEISDLLTEKIEAVTEEAAAEQIVYDGVADMFEWEFTSADSVIKHLTNTNNHTATYDASLNAMVIAPKKDGEAGDMGVVAASSASDGEVRRAFIENVPGNYNYIVLTYLNMSEVDTMIHRYIGSSGEVRKDIKIKKASECDGEWQRLVIDVTDGIILRNGTGAFTSNMCFFPLKGTVTTEDKIAWKSLAFFKTKAAASAYSTEEVGDALVTAARTDTPFISGYAGRLFKPEGNMTRAEAVTVITRLLVDEATIKGKNTSSFSDVKSGSWYYDSIAYLESLGYLKSYSGTFSPDQPITRAEFVGLVYNMGKVEATDKTVNFTDVPATHERYTVITAAASAGLVGGYPDGTFKPDGTITRAEVVKVICSALGRTPTLDNIKNGSASVVGFADIAEEHWAYPYVIEASVEHALTLDEDGNEMWTEAIDNNFYLELATDDYIASLDEKFEARKAEVLAAESEWTLGEGGTVYYVSNNGNDGQLGKTPETAIKTIEKLLGMQKRGTIKAGDVVLFERGGEWHEKLTTLEGVTYSAYGEGDKPRILGSIEADDASQWEATEKANIYKFKGEIPKEQDVGNIVFNDGEAYGMRVLKDKTTTEDVTVKIGDNSIVSNGIETWEFPVQPFKNGLDLNHHLAYYHDWEEATVYLYCEGGNPGDVFDSIELSTRGNVVNAKSNVTIDNLCIRYGASHGVGAGTCENLTVRNCEVGWIGGAIQDLSEKAQGRLGNGIEIYGGANGYYVYNNYVYQCFDCGPTVQWQGTLSLGRTLIEADTEIHDNVIEKCNSPLEVWCTSNTPNSEKSFAILKNCNLYNNLCRSSGYGFGGYIHQKVDYNMFYGAGATNALYENCYVQNNTMWNVRKYLQKAVPTSVENGSGFHWRNNTIIMAYDGPLALLGSDTKNAKGALTKYTYNNETIRKLLADGCYGFNRFMYTLADGQKDPAK